MTLSGQGAMGMPVCLLEDPSKRETMQGGSGFWEWDQGINDLRGTLSFHIQQQPPGFQLWLWVPCLHCTVTVFA